MRREGEFSGESRATMHLYCVPLEKLTRNPEEPEPRADGTAEGGAPEGRRGPAAGRPVTPKTPKIDWDGLKRRTRQVTRAGSVFGYTTGVDGRTLIFVASEGGAGGGGRGEAGGTAAIYSIQDNGKRMTRIAAATPRPAADPGDDRPRGARGGFRGGISNLRLTRDGRTLYFQEGESVYTSPVGGGGGSGGGGFGAMAVLGGRGRTEAAATGEAGSVGSGSKRADQLQRHRPDRQAPGMGRDVRRRLAVHEVPLLRPQAARHRLGRHAGQVQAAGRLTSPTATS